jgi:hypothetical protein
VSDVPDFIGRFRVTSPLGQGGMGTLYLAQDPTLERPVAIKVLTEDSGDLRERFAREARTAARLRHPNIVQVFDVGTFEGRPFIAMEYIPGETLGEMIRRRAPIGIARKLELMEDVCAGLAHAHRNGIIHRDVKPANIMVDSDGVVKILDFGIARLGDSSMTQAGMLVGTVNYMSPEQVSGEPVDTRSDIFAVGAVFYELLTYRKAFAGSITQALVHITRNEPEPVRSFVPDVDPEVLRILQRALMKDAAKRYQDLVTMRRELTRVRARLETLELDTPTVVIGRDQTTIVQHGAVDKAMQIEALLTNANAAIEAGDLEAASAALDRAEALDAANSAISGVRRRLRDRAQDETRQWFDAARQALEVGELTRAEQLVQQIRQRLPNLPETGTLAREVEKRLTERARERQQEAEIAEALDRASAFLEHGALDAAQRAVAEAMMLAPDQPQAHALGARVRTAIAERARRELEQRAEEAIHDARRVFDDGRRREAIAQLQQFAPAQAPVDDAIRRWTEEVEALERAEAEEAERRRVAEEAERRRAAEEAERRRVAEEAERRRAADEAERKRLADELAKQAAAEAERTRAAEETARKLAAEDAAHRAALEAERTRAAEEAERRRVAEEAERHRVAEEAERHRVAEEAERRRVAEKAERERIAADAARRALDEAEQTRLAEAARRIDAERERTRAAAAAARRAAEEAERTRVAEAAERARLAEAAERARIAEAAERARIVEDAERARAAAEQERKRLAAIDADGAWARQEAAAEEPFPATQLSGTRPDVTAVRPREAPRSRRAVYGLIAAAGLALAVGSFGLRVWMRPPTAPVATAQPVTPPPVASSAPAPGSTTSQTQPPQTPVTVAQPVPVAVDAVPWARVTVRSKSTGATLDLGEQITPVILNLPPGDYEVRLVNDEAGKPFTQALHVPAPQNKVTFRFPGYDPDNTLTRILGGR